MQVFFLGFREILTSQNNISMYLKTMLLDF